MLINSYVDLFFFLFGLYDIVFKRFRNYFSLSRRNTKQKQIELAGGYLSYIQKHRIKPLITLLQLCYACNSLSFALFWQVLTAVFLIGIFALSRVPAYKRKENNFTDEIKIAEKKAEASSARSPERIGPFMAVIWLFSWIDLSSLNIPDLSIPLLVSILILILLDLSGKCSADFGSPDELAAFISTVRQKKIDNRRFLIPAKHSSIVINSPPDDRFLQIIVSGFADSLIWRLYINIKNLNTHELNKIPEFLTGRGLDYQYEENDQNGPVVRRGAKYIVILPDQPLIMANTVLKMFEEIYNLPGSSIFKAVYTKTGFVKN